MNVLTKCPKCEQVPDIFTVGPAKYEMKCCLTLGPENSRIQLIDLWESLVFQKREV